MIILGLESSCDDTGAALYDTERGLLAHSLFSQIDMHRAHGGVVPELASRAHVERIMPLIDTCLNDAQIARADIDAIAYTAGPGLVGSLMVAASVASGLSLSLKKPMMAINHLEAHLLAAGLELDTLEFPFATLLVSGGHTLLGLARALGHYEVLGETLDDAVGEAFDKTAKLMGLPYPGGPILADLAKRGDPKAFQLTKPMINRPGLDFSFSGLKTQVMRCWQQSDQTEMDQCNLAASFQQTVVDTLIIKVRRAHQAHGFPRLVVAGGVGANWQIREALQAWGTEQNVEVNFPRIEFCTDNAAMIAYCAALKINADPACLDNALFVKARWPI